MAEHQWVRETLALYVADGLNAADAARLERHLLECAECAEALDEARSLDRRLDTLFAPLRPTSKMEENVVQTLRQMRPRPLVRRNRTRSRRPETRPVSGRFKFLTALCVLFFIAAGAVVTGTLLDPERGFSIPREKMYSHRSSTTPPAAEPDPARLDPEFEVNFDAERIRTFSVPGKVENDQAIGIRDGDRNAPPTNLPAPSKPSPVGVRGYTDIDGAATQYGSGLPLPGSFYGRSGSTRGNDGKNGDSKGWTDYFRPDSQRLNESAKQAKEDRKPIPVAKVEEAAFGGQPKPPPPPDETAPPSRKIVIRTGTMSFEVESFDVAVAIVTKLVVETKGAYVNHKDSEKLANGKVRGTIVVRMPPESLDDFVLKLLRDIGKVGELKMQRVNSQDVTKQYTDLESELRGLRTMEDRILKIIRDGKGEIKDLLAAERELGVYRTKIEKIEGEMRFYANQAALSTLTLDLVEKEIRQAAVIEEQQRIQTGIEVEDVEKALKDAEAMIEELKGRILVSKLNEHKGGQYSADLQFSLSPESTNAMRDRLKQLGATARLEVDRVQSAQGATPTAAAARDVKTRRGDTLFVVALYNLAKVEPREIVHLKVAVPDVVAAFNRLRDDVKKLNGREIVAQAGKAKAQLHVDVRRPDEVALLKKITDAGEELERDQRRSQDPSTTEAKVQVQLELFDAAAIPPRETVKLYVEADKVADLHQKIETLVKASKGRSFDVEQVSNDKMLIKATHDMPLSELAALVREASTAGTVKSQTTTQDTKAPDGKLALGRLHLTLATRAPLVDREQSFGAQFRNGVALSLKGLGYSLLWLVVGVLFFVPWLLVAYACFHFISRLWTAPAEEGVDVEVVPTEKEKPSEP